jgi:hypothetical protein
VRASRVATTLLESLRPYSHSRAVASARGGVARLVRPPDYARAMVPMPRRPIDWAEGLPATYFPGCEALTEGTPMDMVGPFGAMRVYPRDSARRGWPDEWRGPASA